MARGLHTRQRSSHEIDDLNKDLRPQGSETCNCRILLSASAFALAIPCGVALGVGPALPQGRWFTHVMARGVGRQWRATASPGSDYVDSYIDLRPQGSETRTVARLVAASASAAAIPCGMSIVAEFPPVLIITPLLLYAMMLILPISVAISGRAITLATSSGVIPMT